MNSKIFDFKEKSKNVKIEENKNVCPSSRSQSILKMGGRLQFFKDGKFILELARSKEGDKFSWVSVPKKKFNSSTTNSLIAKNDSCTSLSDDNSSVQSFCWQRDHIWRKSVPRKNISKDMCMFFTHSKSNKNVRKHEISLLKRRRPYDNSYIQPLLKCNNNESSPSIVNKTNSDRSESIAKNKMSKRKPLLRKRKTLATVIQNLIVRTPINFDNFSKHSAQSNTFGNFSANTLRLFDVKYQSNVSPRKRILRELEKVSLEDNTKRSRSKAESTLIAANNTNFNSTKPNVKSDIASSVKMENLNSNETSFNQFELSKCSTISPSSKLCSSYSIHSLLGNKNSNNHNNNNNRIEIGLQDLSTCPETRKSKESADYNSITSKSSLVLRDTDNEFDIKILSEEKNNYSSCISEFIKNTGFNDTENRYKNIKEKLELCEKKEFPTAALLPDYYNHLGILSPSEFNYSLRKECELNNLIKKSENIQIQSKLSSQVSTQERDNISDTVIFPKENNSLSPATQINSHLRSAYSMDPTGLSSFAQEKKSRNFQIFSETNADQPFNLDTKSPISNFLEASNMMSYFMYPEKKLPICHTSSPSYISPSSYFHPYAVAALRNPLWINYQSGISIPAPVARLPPTPYMFNRVNNVPSLNSSSRTSDDTLNQVSSSHIGFQGEPTSDLPLNLSKH